MNHRTRRSVALLAVTSLACTAQLSAAANQTQQPATGAYRVLPAVKLYSGVAPGTEQWTCPEWESGAVPDRNVFNIVRPEYTPYLPPTARATGTAVIIAPGGGFRFLAIDNEGIEVAKWLAERGLAAFVLKYTVSQTDPNNPPRTALLTAPPVPKPPAPCAASIPSDERGIGERNKYGIADALRTIAMIRERAKEYGIDTNRIVMTGFSAGANVTTGTILQPDAAARPNFAAPIYGGPFGDMPPIPAGLPPLFIAMAQNDGLAVVSDSVRKFYDALLAAGYQPELHLFNGGNHGFGMHLNGTTSDHWKDSFFWWLESFGLTQKPGDPPRPVIPEFLRPKAGPAAAGAAK